MKPVPSDSTSYLAGFNNRVAILFAAGISVTVFLWEIFQHLRQGPSPTAGNDGTKLSGGFIAGIVLGCSALLALCSGLVTASHLRYLRDAGYFIEVATVKRDTGRALYSQIEFAYGPLLVYPEIWVSRLFHCSLTAAYYAMFVAQSAVGLLAVAYLLNELPIRGRLRQIAFFLLAVGAITPQLGMNYTFFRFGIPFALLWVGMRQRSWLRCALLLALGEALDLLISPELGMAMGVGVLVFGSVRAWAAGWRWIGAALLPLAALGALLGVYGRPFLRAAVDFSQGAFNLPVGPYPHLLVFLFALVWLVPIGLGRQIDVRDRSGAALLAFYAASLAFLPAALGRCDPLHVLFNGMGFWLLSLTALGGSSRTARRVWIGCLAVLVLWNHWVDDRLFDVRNADVVRLSVLPHVPEKVRAGIIGIVAVHRPDLAHVMGQGAQQADTLDMSALNQVVNGAPVATPIDVTPRMEAQLIAAHQYAPGYFSFWINVLSPATEKRVMMELNHFSWLLIPTGWTPNPASSLPVLRQFQGFALPYRERNPSLYAQGRILSLDLSRNWMAVQHLGYLTLYKRRDASSVGTDSRNMQ